jgi:hypothetical protein
LNNKFDPNFTSLPPPTSNNSLCEGAVLVRNTYFMDPKKGTISADWVPLSYGTYLVFVTQLSATNENGTTTIFQTSPVHLNSEVFSFLICSPKFWGILLASQMLILVP